MSISCTKPPWQFHSCTTARPRAQWVLRTSYAGECTGADGPAVLHSHLEVERHEIGIAPNLIQLHASCTFSLMDRNLFVESPSSADLCSYLQLCGRIDMLELALGMHVIALRDYIITQSRARALNRDRAVLKSSGCLSELTVNAGGPPTTPSTSAGSFLPFRGLYSSRCKTGPKGSPYPSSVTKVTIERC